MSTPALSVVILAAGKGTRMKSDRAKVLHEIGGLAMLGHVLTAASALNPERMVVVNGGHAREVGEYAIAYNPNLSVVIQSPPKGTAHAVEQALPALKGFAGAVIVLYADTPLVTPETITALTNEIAGGAGAAVLGFTPDEPGNYGRLKLDAKGALEAIVEAKDASAEELRIGLCNSGVMALDAGFLQKRLKDVGDDNAKGEYYLTDMIALARADGLTCAVVEGDADEVLGVNSRIELAEAEAIFQTRKRRAAMADGATLIDPSTVFFSHDTIIGRDVTIGPNVVFGLNARIDEAAEIKAFSHIEGAHVASGAIVGPYARLRPGAEIGRGAKVGNFVEIKKATLGARAKVSHLTYIGDAEIGAGANIGAGTITCNYDGYAKYKTKIGENAFVGSNTSLVAPIEIGARAYVGSGSVITEDVVEDDLAIARGRQTAIKGWSVRFRQAQQDKKKT